MDGNKPSAVSGLGFVRGKVAEGVTLSPGGFIEIPDSPNLRLQQFTLDAWVRPDGPSPNKDKFGSVIIVKSVTGGNESAGIHWSAIDSRFDFIFGDQNSERIVSQGVFPPGRFYLVAATYDGVTFRLYVNGQLEAERKNTKKTKTITYSSLPWVIGSSVQAFHVPPSRQRTWNGVIDEVEIFDRALDASEILAIFKADSAGKCKKPC